MIEMKVQWLLLIIAPGSRDLQVITTAHSDIVADKGLYRKMH